MSSNYPQTWDPTTAPGGFALVGAQGWVANYQVFAPATTSNPVFLGAAMLLDNQPPPPLVAGVPINPGGFVFDDPANMGRVLYGVFPPEFNAATPPNPQPYSIVFTLTTPAGISAPTAALPFVRAAPPTAPANARLVR